MKLVYRALAPLLLLLVLSAAASAQNYNPNNFDSRKIIDALYNPHSDLVTIAAHRGIHALAGTDQAPLVPENSLQAIGFAAREGWEMVEIDVKLTKDKVPILSHDQTWGRQTCYNACFFSGPFDPHHPDGDACHNPRVDSLNLADIRRPFFPGPAETAILRDSVTLSCGGNSEGRVFPPTLQDVIDYYREHDIQMVLTLDIQTLERAKAAWEVIKRNTDRRGRPFYESTIIKLPADLLFSPNHFKQEFGSDYVNINFIPVFTTSKIARDNFFGSQGDGEVAMINWIASFQQDSTIRMPVIEVGLKEAGGILNRVLQAARNHSVTRNPVTIGQFNPVGEYYPNNDTNEVPQFFDSNDGHCCAYLSDYLFNNAKRQGPFDLTLPYDRDDNRPALPFLINDSRAQMITTDRPGVLADYLKTRNLRNISYMQGGTTPLPTETALRILPLGDSITWGEGDPSGNGYRYSLIRQLLQSGAGVTMVGSERNGNFANNYNEGHRGWRIDQIGSVTNGAMYRWRPNVVTLMAGTNDCLQNNDVSRAPERLEYMVRQLLNASPRPAVALATLIPAASAQSCVQSINARIPGIVSQLQAEGYPIVLADMMSVTLSDLPDGIHPNPAGYQKMASAFYAAIRDLFARGAIQAPHSCSDVPAGCDDPALKSGEKNHLGEGGIDTPPGDGGTGNPPPRTPQPRLPANGWEPHRDWANSTQIDGVIQYADMDGNGRADFVIIDKVTGALHVAWNTGSGWVGPVIFEPTGAAPAARVRLADIDGDGKADYLVIDPNTGAVTGFRNNGANTGGGWIPWGVIASGAAPAPQVQFADMNGDGKADYVVADRWNGALDVYINNGTEMPGGNGWIPMRRAASGAAPGAMVRLADINGDRFADYLVLNPVNGAVVAYLNNGMEVPGGNGWVPLGKIAIGTGAPGSWVQFADISADNVADYLVVNPNGGHTDAYVNKGADLPNDGTPQYPAVTPQPRGPVNGWIPARDWASGTTLPGRIKYADMDGNGRADFVIIDEPSGALNVVWNTGHGWDGPVLYAGGASNGNNVHLADLDGDGKADYIVLDSSTGAVKAYRNDGGNPGNDWGYLGEIAGLVAPASQIQFADMNADGKADYVVIDPSNGALDVYINNGMGVLGGNGWIHRPRAASGITTLHQYQRIHLADFNGDRYADYLVVDIRKNSLDAYLNNGMEVPGGAGWIALGNVAIGAGELGTQVQFADIEADGKVDYLVVDPLNGHTDAYLNRGGDLPQSQP